LRQGDLDVAALDALYRESLIRFCWGYLGNIEEAEDAVQEITYKILRAKNVPDSLRPWIYRIARNHCLNLIRSRSRRKDRGAMPEPSRIDAALTGHLTKLVKEELKDHVAQMLQSLSDAQREVLRLRYVEDLNKSEIAEVLEMPESVVKSRLFEGMKKLRELIPDQDGP
jgi:RNA polymerase sigma-70 factor (ECF subfamily)